MLQRTVLKEQEVVAKVEGDGEWNEWRNGGARMVENDIVERNHLREYARE